MSTTSIDISEARKRFNTLDEDLKSRPVIRITRHNKEAFAVVDIDYLETILETLEVMTDPDALNMLNASIQAIQNGEVFDQEDVEKELG